MVGARVKYGKSERKQTNTKMYIYKTNKNKINMAQQKTSRTFSHSNWNDIYNANKYQNKNSIPVNRLLDKEHEKTYG